MVDVSAGGGVVATPGLKSQAREAGSRIEGAKNFMESHHNNGSVLFFGGALVFLISQLIGLDVIYAYASIALMVYTAYAVFKNKGTFTIILFFVWYAFLGGSSNIANIVTAFLPILGIAAVFHGFLGRGERPFMQNFTGELTYGAMLILIFMIDVGMGDFFLQQFQITLPYFMATFFALVPLWAYLGLMLMLKDEEKKSVLTKILMVVGVLYVIFVITTISTPIFGQGSDNSLLPGLDQAIEAKQLDQDKFKGENPAWSNLVCLSQGRFTDLSKCITERQEESQIKQVCTNSGYEEGSPGYKQCYKEQKEISAQGVTISGARDSTINIPTTAKFVEGNYFPRNIFHDTGREIEYPITLEIENPRMQQFKISLSCNFTDKKDWKNSFQGEIISGSMIDVKGDKPKLSIICRSPDTMVINGSYDLTYNAEFIGLTSSSRLQRAFIGDKTSEWKEEWIPKILSAHFPGDSYLSQGAEDFARLNFGYGNTLENPIVEDKFGQTLSANIQNLGNGKITKVHSYILNGFDQFESGEITRCLHQDNVLLPTLGHIGGYKEVIYLHTCYVDTLPQELANPENYELREFEGSINYDYLIIKRLPIEVKLAR